MTFISSCAPNNITPYSKLDKSDKSITVPAGGGPNASIKTALKQNGWTLKIDSRSIKTGGSSNVVNQATTVESDARYRMLTAFVSDQCLICQCVRSYNISIVDNKTGEEVVAFDGRDKDGICYKTLAKRIIDWIDKQ